MSKISTDLGIGHMNDELGGFARGWVRKLQPRWATRTSEYHDGDERYACGLEKQGYENACRTELTE